MMMQDNTSQLIDHTGRVLMVWQGEPPNQPDGVRRFIEKITKGKDRRKRGKVVKNG